MLGNLIKYEFKSTAKTFLALYGVLLAFALLGRLSIAGMDTSFTDNRYLEVIFGITIFGYVMVVFSAIMLTFFIIVQRFYKNLTGDEGYLMHTLPVSTHKLLLSKVITATLWEFASILMVILSVFVLVFQPEFFRDFSEFFRDLGEALRMLSQEIGAGRLWLNIITAILAGLISTVVGTMMIYAAISIGHTFKKHRVMGGVLAYLGLMIASQIIGGFVSATVNFGNYVFTGNSDTAIRFLDSLTGAFGMAILLEIGFGCAWYFISHYVLTSQLNLE